MDEAQKKCRLCPNGPPFISVCLSCQTRLEIAEKKLAQAEKDRDMWKRNYFRVMGERHKSDLAKRKNRYR